MADVGRATVLSKTLAGEVCGECGGDGDEQHADSGRSLATNLIMGDYP